MSQDKEFEIQLQFLEEAQEYLDSIESVLLGLANRHIDSQNMDAVLRAAHSVKGGAGMMGFVTLSQLAHRLEDSFKVLKAQRNVIEVDAQLESLLLAGVDRLRQVLDCNRRGSDVDEQWLATIGNPVFEMLHERLGDPVADDATTMLGGDDGTNVAALLFETEVEGCLNRLESVLADPQAPCLREELSIMAQELGGLGEMLQLSAFTQLCESVIQHLEAAPEQLKAIAQSTLDAWRRSQALVLVGQVATLPTELFYTPEAGASVTQAATLSTPTLVFEEHDTLEVVAAEFDFYAPTQSLQQPLVTAEHLSVGDDEAVAPEELTVSTSFSSDFLEETVAVPPIVEETYQQSESIAVPEDLVAEHRPTVRQDNASLSRGTQTELGDVQPADWRTLVTPTSSPSWREEKPLSATGTQPKDSQENTVRIPVRQLDRLNDLFGELTIERNGLGLHLGRLRNLIENLSRRVSTLEQSNIRLRTAYDTVATQSTVAKDEGTRLLAQRHVVQDEDSILENENIHPSSFTLHTSFDALEMDRYSDLHLLSMEVMETIVQIQEVTSDIGLSLEDTDSMARELNQTAKQLQTNLTRVRMRPLSDLVGRFHRALRDLSLQYGKQVELKVLGKGTLIDRSILEALSDPLMHLVRNAFDHGIEVPATRVREGKPAKGIIEIKAAHRGNQTIITVSDDGNGINLDKIRARAEAMGLDAGLLAAASEDELLSLIFEPGFSTADQVTALSGRGVGMDVVRNNLKSIRGDIRVDTTPGRGTTFTLTVPFTLTVARVLLVESNGMLLAFPTDVIEEMLLLRKEDVLTTPMGEVLNWEGEMVPLFRLGASLTFYCPRKGVTSPEGVPSISEPTVLMISMNEQMRALSIDRCWGEREVAIRQVEGTLVMPPGFTSCTILGDGKVVPLVDAQALLRHIASGTLGDSSLMITQAAVTGDIEIENREHTSKLTARDIAISQSRVKDVSSLPPDVRPQRQKDTILVVDDSINVRRFLALALEKAGYLVEQAKDGQDALRILHSLNTVCAVICDIEMPRLDGYGFLARVKSDPATLHIPIAMLTSRSGDKHRQLAMTLGAAAYFSKPYNERELLKTLLRIITESRATFPDSALEQRLKDEAILLKGGCSS